MLLPNLVRHYLAEQEQLFGFKPWLSEKHFDRFRNAEVELMQAHAPVDEFARIVSIHWKDFVKSKGMGCVPVNMFLGDKSKEAYNAYLERASVMTLSREEDELSHVLLLERSFFQLYGNHRVDECGTMTEQEFRTWWTTDAPWNTHSFEIWSRWQVEHPNKFYEVRMDKIKHAAMYLPRHLKKTPIRDYTDYYDRLLQTDQYVNR